MRVSTLENLSGFWLPTDQLLDLGSSDTSTNFPVPIDSCIEGTVGVAAAALDGLIHWYWEQMIGFVWQMWLKDQDRHQILD